MTTDDQSAIHTIWPRARALLVSVMNDDEKMIRKLLHPYGTARQLLDLYGLVVLEVMLKTLIGRYQVGLNQAVAADADNFVYLEFVWLAGEDNDPDVEYDSADMVSVRMRQFRGKWRVYDINPSGLANWLNALTAAEQVTELVKENNGEIPQTAQALPLALVAGRMKLPLKEDGFRDTVEKLLLPMLQEHGFGALGLVKAQKLWRAFVRKHKIDDAQAPVWAAAVECIMSEQAMTETTQAAVGKAYGVSMVKLFAPIRRIKETLKINGVDERFTPLKTINIIVN